MTWCRVLPVAKNVNTSSVPSTANQAGISPLDGTADGVRSFTITSLPTNGTLFYNTTGTTYAAVALNQVLTDAQAASLRYTPNATFTGTSATFGYTVKDDANLVSPTTATYTIPLQYIAPCTTATALLDFATRPTNEDWRTHANLSVPTGSPRTQISSGGYAVGTNDANSLVTNTFNTVQTLLWNTDYNVGSNKTSTVTFTFTRAVSNFTVQVQDIDLGGSYIDQVTFTGANGGTAVTPSLTKANASSAAVSVSGNVATGTANTTSAMDGTVTAYFPAPITTLTLTYKNTDPAANGATAYVGIDNMTWCRLAPTTVVQTNGATLPTSAGQVGIDNLNSTVDGTVKNYTITAIPDATQGVLYYNSSATTTPSYVAITGSQALTPAQAASLRFDPAPNAPGPSAVFSFTATDDGNVVSNTSTFTIPLQVTAPCVATTTLDFATTGATGENWKNHAALASPTGSTVTQISSGGYTVDNASLAASTLAIGVQTAGNTILWKNDYAAGSPKTSSVTFTFSRPVSNFAVQVEDIDVGTAYVDQVVFAGKNGTTAVTPTLSAVDPNQNYFTISGATATGIVGAANNGTRTGASVIAYFPAPITTLTLTYNNSAPDNDGAAQAIGIDMMTWCRATPVPNDITNATLVAGQGQTAISSLTSTTDGGTAASYTISALPPAAQGTYYVNGVVLNTTNFPGLVLTPTQATQLSFAPAATFSGNAGFTYTVKDDANQTSTTHNTAGTVSNGPAVYNIPVTPLADVTTTITGPTTLSVNQPAGSYPPYTATFTNNGPGTATNVSRMVKLPAGATVTAANLPAGATFTTTGGITTIDFGPLASLTSGAGGASTVSFSFTAPATAGSYPLTSTTSTDANEGTNAAANTATLTLQVNNSPANCQKSYYDNTNSYSGLSAFYYKGDYNNDPAFFTNSTANPVTDKGVASTINYLRTNPNTGGTFPITTATVNATNNAFSAQYKGNVYITTAGAYTFSVSNPAVGALDDRAQLYLDGKAVGTPVIGDASISVTNFNAGTPTVTLNLSSGTHNILLQYSATGQPDRVSLSYSGPDNPTLTVIPNSVLCAGPGNVPPIALDRTNANIPNNAGPTTLSPSLGGTDQDGSVAKYAIATLPLASQGVLRLNGTAVTLNQVITAAQAAQLTFQPATSFTGTASFTYSAIDNSAINNNAGQYSNDVATYNIPVSASADLTTTLAGPTVLNASQPSGTFTATFSNNGPDAASGVTQAVTIPAGATNVLVNGVAYTPTGNVINFGTATTLASGATNTFTYSFTAPATGPVTQTSNVGVSTTSTTSQGANTAPDSATLTSTVNPVADVATTITRSAASVAAGTTASFDVVFKNNGPSDASTVTATVQLAAGLSNVVITGYGAGTATYNSATGVVTYPSVATLTNGTTNNSTISFTMPANGSLTGTATINTTTNEAGLTTNDVASATISGTPVFDLTTKISGPATTVAGTLTTYSVLTINNGPSSASNVGQTVQLPMNLTNVFVSNGGTYDATSGVVTFPTLSGLTSGAVANNTISFMAPSAAFPVSATVSGDANTANNTAYLNGSTTSTNVAVTSASTTNANLYTTITTPSANVQPGAAITFTVVAGNNGKNAATSVVERVELPSGLTGVTVSGGGSYDANTGIVTFPIVPSLTSGTATTYTITVNAPASGIIAATASIAATTNDVMMADNVATTDVTVNGQPDVATTISGPTKANAGQSVTYTVTTTNNGLAPAANVVQTVNIPAGLTSVTISGSGTYDPNTGIVTFPAIAGQASGNSVQNTITYNTPAVASTMVIASVTSSSPDNVKTNNRAAITTTTDAISDVTVSLTGPATIVQGNQIDYLVVTTNNGPSPASDVATRVQLPAGLGVSGTDVILSAGGSYDNATGIVTFSTLGTERAGQPGTVTNVIRFKAPAGLSQINATASVSTTSEEASYANNTSSIITTETAPTTAQTNLGTTITSTPTTLTAGQPASLTVTTSNGGPNAATGVIQRVALEAGLTISSITNGGTYDAVTGIVTFPAISLTSGTTTTNTITLVAPGTNPLQVRALVTGNESDPTPGNNSDFKSLTVNPVVDVATSVSGPNAVATGDAVTYSVLTLNNGPSSASNVVQKVTIPTGLPTVVGSTSAATSLLLNGAGPTSIAGTVATYAGVGTYDSSTGIITYSTIATQNGDASSQVMNTISFTAPSTSFTVVGNVTTSSTEPGTTAATNNNTSTVIVGPINTAPVANAVVNALQTPEGNTAGPLLLSPLSATDTAPGTVASYRIATIPTAAQGVLSLNGTAVKVGDVILTADASKLRFDPVTTFVGNAFFTYTAIDNQNVASAVAATYTIPVGQDNVSVFTSTPTKGGATPYQNGDVVSNGFDDNGGVYNSAAAVTDNGIRSATTDANGMTTLTDAGIALDAVTGQLTVADRTKLKAGTYTLSITTTDVNGGVTTQLVSFTIGTAPLPVTLVAFTAEAVRNRDAQLRWSTASEKNNDHFEVERSLDGSTFTKLGQVAGQGTSTTNQSYIFTDAAVAAKATGPVYYRLKQVDTDGTSTYSPVRTVSFTHEQVALSLTLFPNPATTSTALDLRQLPATAQVQVLVLDATGRTVLSTTLGGGLPQPLDVSNLAQGTYNVVVSGTQPDGSPLYQVLRFIKE